MRGKFGCTSISAAIALTLSMFASQAGAQAATQIDLPAQSLADSIRAVARQSSINILVDPKLVEGRQAPAVKARMTATEALSLLLSGTGLSARFVDERTITLVPTQTLRAQEAEQSESTSATRAEGKERPLVLSQAPAPSASAERGRSDAASPTQASRSSADTRRLDAAEATVRIPEVLVVGSRILNMDIARSRDDTQPYVIFEREAIERSGAANLETFLKQRLPMNTVARSNAQTGGVSGNGSQINLRGLGTNQTLILIDGHRTASVNSSGSPLQTDLNGIPLSAIERIEVLPTTASAIYGGSATGGVVNIVLRRDYAGFESKVTYENGFDSDSSARRVELSAGFNLEGGKTSILVAGSYADANTLLVRERDLLQRGRAAAIANNPAGFLPPNAPPLGATPNIRSATVVGGVVQNLTLDNGTALNSTFTSVPLGYAGASSDGGQAFLTNAGVYNLDLANSAQSAGGDAAGLLAAPTVESGMVTVRRQFTDHLQLFLDASASNNTSYLPGSVATPTFTIPANTPTNPFQQNIQVRVPIDAVDGANEVRNSDRRVVAGAIYQLPGKWSAGADYTWNRSRLASSTPPGLAANATTAVGNGSIDVLRDTNAFPVDFAQFAAPPSTSSPAHSTLKDVTLRAAGPVGSLPGGAPTVSALIEHRDEELGETFTFFSTGQSSFIPDRSQTVKSAYLEVRAPLVSNTNAKPGLQELELQLSGRHDDYAVKGVTSSVLVGSGTPIDRATNELSSTDYTVGLRYSPVRDVMLRASYGTGFLPPSLTQVVTTPFNFVASSVRDPRRGNSPAGPAGAATIPTLFGGNPDLGPEESKSWAAGIILTPRFLPGLRISVDYERIEKTENIQQFGAQFILDNESFFPGRVTRDPAARNPDDPPTWADPVTFLDFTAINIAQAQVEAYDVQLDYALQTERFGDFEFFAVGTQQTHFKTQIIPSAPVVENVGINGTISIPLKTKVNAGLLWKYGHWTLGWAAQYFDSYLASTNAVTNASQGDGGRVPSQIYHDAVATYRFENSSSWLLSGLELQVGLKNVLDEEPPFDASNATTFYSYLGDPRLRSYYVSLRKGF